MPTDSHRILDIDALTALYPAPAQSALDKESPVITPGYAALIGASPFAVVANHGPRGLDCSPRGDRPGFVQVLDENTLLLPDRRGNNRLDTLTNLLHDPAIALIFLIPGIGETVRVRGAATITTAPALLGRFPVGETLPATVIRIAVSRVYFQCRRAVVRAGLWDADDHPDPTTLPSAGDLQAETGLLTAEQAAAYDADLEDRVARTLYAGPTQS